MRSLGIKWPAVGKGGGGAREGGKGGGRSGYWEMPFETAGQSGRERERWETLDAGRGWLEQSGRRVAGREGREVSQ